MRRASTLSAMLALTVLSCVAAAADESAEWNAVLATARGQTVYWKAWAGSEATNSYIRWVADEVGRRYGVTLRHVKIVNPSELVSGTLAEKTAGRHSGGSTDLLWINGENFAAMKQKDLLYGPFTHKLPNFVKYVDANDPAFTHDFTVPVVGYEAPWGMARVIFIYDSAYVHDPPTSMAALLRFARRNPGRFTHPQVRNFMGSTFLKQALYELVEDRSVLPAPATDARFGEATAPLWAWYDQLKPYLWRRGRRFPESGPVQHRLLADGEVDLSMAFSPFEASRLILNGMFPNTVRTYIMDVGTIGNANFLAIPYNSAATEGAMTVINFLLSPEAQLRGQDPSVRGSFTVLDVEKLPEGYRKKFAALELGPATLSPEELGPPLPEPHPSWMDRLVDEWHSRYAN
jgi:putative thiamine transport system substrate-binding protein